MIIDKGQEKKRMKPVGPVSIDPFADEEFYKPKNALSSSGVKIKYKYNWWWPSRVSGLLMFAKMQKGMNGNARLDWGFSISIIVLSSTHKFWR